MKSLKGLLKIPFRFSIEYKGSLPRLILSKMSFFISSVVLSRKTIALSAEFLIFRCRPSDSCEKRNSFKFVNFFKLQRVNSSEKNADSVLIR